jgi:hypothetical protein
LPQHHLSSESKDIVRLGTGLLGTMAALLLGLLVASAKSSYDAEKAEVTQMAARIAFLDRVLANYGAEAGEARDLLRRSLARAIERMWPQPSAGPAQLDPGAGGKEALYDAIHRLPAQNDMQQSLKSQALGMLSDIGQTRWLLYEQRGSSISHPFLIVVVAWLTIIFVSLGLFAPPNATVIATLLLCALSVAGAIFLILELDHPFDGMIRISSAPMRVALEHLGK